MWLYLWRKNVKKLSNGSEFYDHIIGSNLVITIVIVTQICVKNVIFTEHSNGKRKKGGSISTFSILK